ncbi:LacI family DNA-binding transcriptional regulator [Aerococcaceae bacterium NML210727]|nr:LacI family DNA-binding transcriptional regulator [Aerococcaceae bacterium NML210727]
MMRQTTLKDVARLANVSISTISRVVNGGDSTAASKEVQNRIWEVVKQTNYIPNRSAQQLKHATDERTHPRMVACICSRSANVQTDPFFSEISRAIETELNRLGYIMKLSLSSEDSSCERLNQMLSYEKLEGVIVLGKMASRHIRTLRKHCKHIVYTGVNRLNETIDQVICDGYEASWQVLQYFVVLGLHDIYYVGETQCEVRYRAYKEFMESRGHLMDLRQKVIECPFDSQQAYEGTRQMLQTGKRPEAIFCGNDVTALGVIKALREQGLDVPSDVSVIGIDDIEMAQFSSPMLSTVQVPRQQLGKVSAKLLVDRIEHGQDLPMTVILPSHLILRESCVRTAQK